MSATVNAQKLPGPIDAAIRRTVTHVEFLTMLNAQGVPRHHYAFRCVRCGHIQSPFSLARHMTQEEAVRRCTFSCEGRFCDGSVGCDWTLGGLFQIHKLEVVVEDDVVVGMLRTQPTFEPATPEEAQALMREVTQGRPI